MKNPTQIVSSLKTTLPKKPLQCLPRRLAHHFGALRWVVGSRCERLLKNPLLKDLTILSASALFLQFFSGLYRIYLVKRVGPETIGLVGMVFPLYRMVTSLITLGLPTILARFVAADYAQGDWGRLRLYKRTSFLMVAVMASCLSAGLLLFSTPLGRLLYQDYRARPILAYLAPVLLITGLTLVYKGYFRGLGQTLPLALSEIGELLVESCFVLQILGKTVPPVETGVKIMTTGYLIGELSSLFILLLFDGFSSASLRNKAQASPIESETIRSQRKTTAARGRLLRSSLPLLARSLILSFSSLTEGILLPKLLIEGGLAPAVATGAAGRYWGMAQPIAYFPLVFLFPLSTIILPATARASVQRKLPKFMKKIRKLLLLALCYSAGSALLLLKTGDRLSALLFKAPLPHNQLLILAASLPLLTINILLISVAEGLGEQNFLFLSSLVLISVKTGIMVALTPGLGICGAILADLIEQAILTAGLLWRLRKTGLFLPIS